MAIWMYECEECGVQFKTKRANPEHCGKISKKLMNRPSVKLLEKEDPFFGKSNLVGSDAIFLERSRNYSRDHETQDLIEMNKDHTNPEKQGWVVDGRSRRKIDDL